MSRSETRDTKVVPMNLKVAPFDLLDTQIANPPFKLDNTKIGWTKLVRKEAFDSKEEDETLLGWVLALPQEPGFRTEHYAELVEEEGNAGLEIEGYTREWFERIVYIAAPTIEGAVRSGALSQLEPLVHLSSMTAKMASPFSAGCASTAPMVHTYEVNLDRSQFTLEPSEVAYHSYVETFDIKDDKLALKIAIFPIDVENSAISLRRFRESKKHIEHKQKEANLPLPSTTDLVVRTVEAVVDHETVELRKNRASLRQP